MGRYGFRRLICLALAVGGANAVTTFPAPTTASTTEQSQHDLTLPSPDEDISDVTPSSALIPSPDVDHHGTSDPAPDTTSLPQIVPSPVTIILSAGSCEGHDCSKTAVKHYLGTCFCDNSCEVLGDCCADKIQYCKRDYDDRVYTTGPAPMTGQTLPPGETTLPIDNAPSSSSSYGPTPDLLMPAPSSAEPAPGDATSTEAPLPDKTTPTCAGDDCTGLEHTGRCFCDNGCFRFGDCCADKLDFCPTTSTTTTKPYGEREYTTGPAPMDVTSNMTTPAWVPPSPEVDNPAPTTTGVGSTASAGSTTEEVRPAPLISPVPAPYYIPAPSPNQTMAPKGTCEGFCGGAAWGKRCWCEAGCMVFNDCCDDFLDHCNYTTTTTLPENTLPAPSTTLGDHHYSCEGHCGTQTRSGCYCTDDCENYNDCCQDYDDACEDYVPPSPAGVDSGCMDSDACNYSPAAEVEAECIYIDDVADSVGASSTEFVDCSGCVVDFDCEGVCGGSAEVDVCDVCHGDGLSCAVCSDSAACNYDENFGTADIVDDGACVYSNSTHDCHGNCVVDLDCTGACGGSVTVDECGVCGGDGTCCVTRIARRLTREFPAPDGDVPAPSDAPLPDVPAPSPDVVEAVEPAVSSTSSVTEAAQPAPDTEVDAISPSPLTSCLGNCHALEPIINSTDQECWCDDHCYNYNDCCLDKEVNCPFYHGQPVPSPEDSGWNAPTPEEGGDIPAPSPEDFFESQPAPLSTAAVTSTETTQALFNSSCDGLCLQSFGSAGRGCRCDWSCQRYDDCCHDFETVCEGVTTSVPYAPGSCEGSECDGINWDLSCYCDEVCALAGDCCADRDTLCEFDACFNGKKDGSEEGVDCGGTCDLTCDNCLACDYDCTGECILRGETAVEVDACGVCGGDSSACAGCHLTSACNYNENSLFHDGSLCEFPTDTTDCFGSCTVDIDCNGDCGGDAEADACGVCEGDSSSCTGCAQDSTACNYQPSDFITIEVCFYPESDIIDCFGNCLTNYDCCNVCGGDNSTCSCTTTTQEPLNTTEEWFPTRSETQPTTVSGVPSCQGYCDMSVAPTGCWCSSECHYYGDCCPDRDRACRTTTEKIQTTSSSYVCNEGFDCNGECGGTAELDSCDVCNGFGASCVGSTDCNGEPEGSAVVDECGVCDGFGASCAEEFCSNGTPDCNGECDGSLAFDSCDVCGGDGTSCCSLDCDGECGGSAVIDSCDVCGGNGATCAIAFCSNATVDCSGECEGTSVVDSCDVCGGDGTSCEEGACDDGDVDCFGVCDGSAVYDECDVCDGNGATCAVDFCSTGTVDCNGECDGSAELDSCDVCEGDGSTCCEQDCDGNCDGSAVVDSCDVCGGFGASCATEFCAAGTVDCNGECDGSAVIDECDVCGGDGTSCVYCAKGTVDCKGECDGSRVEDECGICAGDGSTCQEGFCDFGVVDCAGECNGYAMEDECGICEGNGATCSEGFCVNGTVDCEGVCDGSAILDACDTCGGDSTSCESAKTCADMCGNQTKSGCWCDDTCKYFGDCCLDIDKFCLYRPPPAPAPAPGDDDLLELAWTASDSHSFFLPSSRFSSSIDGTTLPEWEGSVGFISLIGESVFDTAVSIDGYLESGESDVTPSERFDDTINFILRTPTVYPDNRWCNVVIWTDGPGTKNVDVAVIVTLESGEQEEFACGELTTSDGIECEFLVDADWFSASSADSDVVVVTANSTSAAQTLEFASAANHPDLTSEATIWVELPQYPSLIGGVVEIPLRANTVLDDDSFALTTFVVSLTVSSINGDEDSSAENCIELVNVESELYDITHNTDENVVTFVGTQKSTVEDESLLSSENTPSGILELALLTWQISASASAAGVESVYIDDMVTAASLKAVSAADGYIVKGQHARTVPEAFVVEDVPVIGLQPHLDDDDAQEFANLAVLGSSVPSKTVTIFQVSKCHPLPSDGGCQESDTREYLSSDDGSLSCDSQDASQLDAEVGSATTCIVGVDGDESGGDDVTLEAIFETNEGTKFACKTVFRVWYPTLVQVDVADSSLSSVATAASDKVASGAFQSTRALVTAKFVVGFDYATPRVDVTQYVELASTDTDVATVSASAVHGVGSGKAEVECDSCFVSASSAALAVSDDDIVSATIDPVVITGVADFAVEDLMLSSSERQPFYRGSMSTTLEQKFSAEGDSGYIFIYIDYSDGNRFLTDTNADFELFVNPGAANLTLIADSDPFELVVPVGGDDQEGKFGGLEYTVDGTLVATADVNVIVSKPSIASVAISADVDVIYPGTDTMAKPPFNLPTRAVMTTTVTYIDGSTQDFSSDKRALYSSDSDVVSEAKGVYTVAVDKFDVNVVQEEITISVDVGGFTDSTTIAVDIADSMSIVSNAFPECELDGCPAKQNYYRLQSTSGPYQRFTLSASIGTALGSSHDLSMDWTISKFDTDQLTIYGGYCAVGRRELNGLSTTATTTYLDDDTTEESQSTAEAPAPSPFEQACEELEDTDCCDVNGDVGTYPLSLTSSSSLSVPILVTFREFSLELDVKKKSSVVLPSDLDVVSPADSIGTVETIETFITFSDDTAFNTADAYYSVQNYLNFAVETTDLLSVTTTGDLTPLANSVVDEYAEFSVSGKAASSPSESVSLIVNLAPEEGDVDIGSASGFQFQKFDGASVGDVVEVPVRFNSGNTPLTGFQIQVYFDNDVIEAVDVANGEDWEQSVTATLGSPSTMVQILSSAPDSTIEGANLELAVISFKVVGAGTTSITGLVLETLTSDGVHIGDDDRDVVAGAGIVEIGADRRSLSRTMLAQAEYAAPLRRRRQLVDCTVDAGTGCLRGDANADCSFSLSDLDFLKRYKAGAITDFDDEDYQLRMMDVDLDDDVDGVDITFMLFALAKKYLFLKELPTVQIAGCHVNVSFALCNDNSEVVQDSSAVSVAVEIGSKRDLVEVTNLTVGTFANQTDNGVLVDAAGPESDVYGASSFSVVAELASTDSPYDVGIVVIVETLTDTGGVDNQRKFPWRGTSFGYFGEAGYEFHPIVTVEYGCTCDAGCSDPGYFKSGCNADGSTSDSASCTLCSSDTPNVIPLTNGGVTDTCEFDLCPKAYVCDFPDSMEPIPCPGGTYQDTLGGDECKPCPPGTFQPEDAQSQCLECSNDCGIGNFTSGCNATEAGECAPCTPRMGYKFVGNGYWNDTCAMEEVVPNCPNGQYLTTEDYFTYSCIDCDAAPENEFHTDQGGFFHICPAEPCFVGCDVGYYNSGCGGTNAGECTACTAPANGTFIVGDGDLDDACPVQDCSPDSCEIGHYLTGCTDTSAGSCVECSEPEDGYFTGNGGLLDECGQTACVTCPVGDYLSGCGGTSAGECVPCTRDSGYYITLSDDPLRDDICDMVQCEEDCDIGFYRAGCEGTNEGSCVACSDPDPGYVIVGDGGLEDNCDVESCSASCPIGQYNNDCGNLDNPDGTCVPCSEPPPGYYFVGDGDLADACDVRVCNPGRCSASEYLFNCSGTSRGSCKSCTVLGLGQYFISGGGLRDACEVADCDTSCPVGYFLDGCEGTTSEGTCVPCTNAPEGSIYSSNGGLANACEFVQCDASCDAGEYLVNCTADSEFCSPCTNMGSTVCMRTGAGSSNEFAYTPGSSNKEIARLACQAENGAGNCEEGSCGGFEYFFNFEDGHCDCGKAVGTIEWVFGNKLGYVYVDQDYRANADDLETDVDGDSLFTRVRTESVCDGSRSWDVQDLDLGQPTDSEKAASNQDCGYFYYTDHGAFSDDCPTALCNIDCPAHQYNSGCQGNETGQCTNCSAIPDGYYYSDDGDLVDSCKSAECVDECPDGFYLKDCYLTAGSCQPCTAPSDGYYLSSNGDQQDACTEELCTESCPVGYFLHGECGGEDGSSNVECVKCLGCSLGFSAATECDGSTTEDVTECVASVFSRGAVGDNNVFSFDNSSYIVFGSNNTAIGKGLFIGNGDLNLIETSPAENSAGGYSAISGGTLVKVAGDFSVAAGGQRICVGGEAAFALGGVDAQIDCGSLGERTSAFSAGGGKSRNDGVATFNGGGFKNKLTENAEYSSIGGGQQNSVGNDYGNVLGGRSCKAVSNFAAVAGGYACKANGRYSTVLGGARNTANGKYSTSGGFQSRAANTRSLVLGFDKSKYCRSLGTNSINTCVQNGYYINDMELSDMVKDANARRHLGDSAPRTAEAIFAELDPSLKVIEEQDVLIQQRRTDVVQLRNQLEHIKQRLLKSNALR